MSEMERYKIEDCFHLRARIGWQGLRADEFTDHGPCLVTGTDFVNGKIDWDTCYHVDERRYKQDVGIQLREHDLLITKDGTIGKTAVVHDCPEKVTLNSGVFVVRAINGKVVPEFLYYVLNSHQFDLFMRNILTGSTIKHLNQEHFYKFTFEAPDSQQQSKIAEVLATIDEAIDKTRSLTEKYRSIKAGLMQDLLGEGDEVTLGDAVVNGISSGITRKYRESGEYCVYGSTGIIGYTDCPDYSGDRILVARVGANAGTINRVSGKYGISDNTLIIFHKTSDISIVYLYYALQYSNLNKLIFGTGQPLITSSQLKKVKISLPSFPRQQDIAERLTAADSKIEAEQAYLAKLQCIKNGLMQDLLTNTVSVDTLM